MRQPLALLFSPDDEGVQGPPDSLLRRGGGLGFGAGTTGVRAHGHRAGRPRSRRAHLGHLLPDCGGRILALERVCAVLVRGRVVAETHGHTGLMLVLAWLWATVILLVMKSDRYMRVLHQWEAGRSGFKV